MYRNTCNFVCWCESKGSEVCIKVAVITQLFLRTASKVQAEESSDKSSCDSD